MHRGNKKRNKLIISSILTIILIFIVMGNMHGIKFLNDFASIRRGLWFGLLQIILVTPIIIINFHFFINGYKALFKLYPNMDSLISIGSTFATCYSLLMFYQTAINNEELAHLYFETVAMIITIVSLGKLLEDRAKRQTKTTIEKLINLMPKTANVLINGEIIEKNINEITYNDIIIVKPGEKVPLDGIIGRSVFSVFTNASPLYAKSTYIDAPDFDAVIDALNKNKITIRNIIRR